VAAKVRVSWKQKELPAEPLVEALACSKRVSPMKDLLHSIPPVVGLTLTMLFAAAWVGFIGYELFELAEWAI
jgi:hypothetical protein